MRVKSIFCRRLFDQENEIFSSIQSSNRTTSTSTSVYGFGLDISFGPSIYIINFDDQLSVLARMGQSGTTRLTPYGALLHWQNTKFPNGAPPPREANTAVKSASGYGQSGAPPPLGANVAVISAGGYGHNFQR